MIRNFKRLTVVLLLASFCACTSKPINRLENTTQENSKLDLSVAALDQAEKLYRSADWPRAQIAYEELSRGFPRNSFIWFRLGNVMARQGQYEAAVSAYNSALMADNANLMAAYNVGLVRLAQADSAFEAVEARLRNQPELAHQIRGLRQATRDQLERATRSNVSDTPQLEKPAISN
jgi:tetratricopeptide (TPR) repeat protein